MSLQSLPVFVRFCGNPTHTVDFEVYPSDVTFDADGEPQPNQRSSDQWLTLGEQHHIDKANVALSGTVLTFSWKGGFGEIHIDIDKDQEETIGQKGVLSNYGPDDGSPIEYTGALDKAIAIFQTKQVSSQFIIS